MSNRGAEQGFVLATSLVMLLLLTMLTAAVFISVDASQKSSVAAESSAEAFYYAETAVNYIGWALLNNAEFDSYTYPNPVKSTGEFSFEEPSPRGVDPVTDSSVDPYTYLPDPVAAGDYAEWRANRGNPSGDQWVTVTVGGVTTTTYGQLMYYDNAPLDSRMVSLRGGVLFSKAVQGDVTMHEIHKELPRYIRLDIDSDGNITPAIPVYSATAPHHGNVEGVDFPTNGAIVWVTGGNRTDDHVLDPIDHYASPLVRTSDGVGDPYGNYTALACSTAALNGTEIACSTTGAWFTGSDYGLVIYAVGYVGGKARKVIRVVYN